MKTRQLRWVVAVPLVMLVFISAGWAAEEVSSEKPRRFVVNDGAGPAKKVRNRDGSMSYGGNGHTSSMSSDDPNVTQEDADRKWQAMKKAIDKGNFKLIGTKRSPNGEKFYRYRVTLEDGTTQSVGTNVPMQNWPRVYWGRGKEVPAGQAKGVPGGQAKRLPGEQRGP
jgi:hypothetical protein